MAATLHIFPDKTAYLVEDCGAVVNVTGNVGAITGSTTVSWAENEERGEKHIENCRAMWEARLAAAKKVAAP